MLFSNKTENNAWNDYAAQMPTLKAHAGQHSVHADVSTNEIDKLWL